MKINIGCGRHVLEGWTNVDVQRSPLAKRSPEILSKADKIPLPDGCADEVMAIHLFEHFYRWEAQRVLAEWHRLLKKGGQLTLEMPNIILCAKNLLKLVDQKDEKHVDSMAMYGFYGDPRLEDPYMCHKWGWHPKSLQAELKAAGFTAFSQPATQWHAIGRAHRDFRMEARKA